MKTLRFALAAAASVALLMACDSATDPNEIDQLLNEAPDGINTGNVCSQGLCASDTSLSQECDDFLTRCLQTQGEDTCVATAYLFCGS